MMIPATPTAEKFRQAMLEQLAETVAHCRTDLLARAADYARHQSVERSGLLFAAVRFAYEMGQWEAIGFHREATDLSGEKDIWVRALLLAAFGWGVGYCHGCDDEQQMARLKTYLLQTAVMAGRTA